MRVDKCILVRALLMHIHRFVFIDLTLRSLVTVIAHEIAHSWTGNLVTNATWEHFWLNEVVFISPLPRSLTIFLMIYIYTC